jgi:acyl-CoA reductase-like NAD-dependent aldehyde dehydrogenase
MYAHDGLFIGGRWIPPVSKQRITVVSPSTEETVGSAPEAVEADVDAAVAAARDALEDPQGWSSWTFDQRADVMERFAAALEEMASETARIVSAENGMPIAISSGLEGLFPIGVTRYYANVARDTEPEVEQPGFMGGATAVRREPIGVVAAIVPWNFPQTLAAFKYAPAMAAGCTMVIKPSPETALDAGQIARAAEKAGLPPGVINIVPAGRDIGAYLVGHPGVDKVSFTGSTAAGRSIGETCGRLLRPVTLELGGKSAAIICDDVELDLGRIGKDLFQATLLNQGQTCFLSTRILAPASRYDEVVEAVVGLVSSLRVGDALSEETDIGPMVSAAQRERVEGYIAKGRAEGARVVLGGGRPADRPKGWFVEPTIFTNVDNNYTIAQEEIFGPVLTVIRYRDDADAIRIANDSDYGLAGTVWTQDQSRGVDIARQMKTGTVGINHYMPDMNAPFGGVKCSGLGHELSADSINHYSTVKSIYL